MCNAWVHGVRWFESYVGRGKLTGVRVVILWRFMALMRLEKWVRDRSCREGMPAYIAMEEVFNFRSCFAGCAFVFPFVHQALPHAELCG